MCLPCASFDVVADSWPSLSVHMQIGFKRFTALEWLGCIFYVQAHGLQDIYETLDVKIVLRHMFFSHVCWVAPLRFCVPAHRF